MMNEKNSGKLRKKLIMMIMVVTIAGMVCVNTEDASAAVKAPAKVTLTSVSASSHDAVVIKWKAVKKAKGYQVYRNGDVIKNVSGNKTTSFKDIGLASNTSYTYKVRAYTTYKQKKWYNKKTKKWQKKKPAKKYRGKRAKRTVYKYGSFSVSKSVRTETIESINDVVPSAHRYTYRDIFDLIIEKNCSIFHICAGVEASKFKGNTYYYKNKSQTAVVNNIYDSLMGEKEFVIDIEAANNTELETKIRDLNTLLSQKNDCRVKPFSDETNKKGNESISDIQAAMNLDCAKGGTYYYRVMNYAYGSGVTIATHNKGHYRVQVTKNFSSTYKANVNAVESIYEMRTKQRVYDESKYGNYYIDHVSSSGKMGKEAFRDWDNQGTRGKANYEAVKNNVEWNYRMDEPRTISGTGEIIYPRFLYADYSKEDAYDTGLSGIAINRYGDTAGQSSKLDTAYTYSDVTSFFKDTGWRTVKKLYKRMYQTDAGKPFSSLTTEQKVIILTAVPMLYPEVDYGANSDTYGYKYCASTDPSVRNRFTITWSRDNDSVATRLNKMADPTQNAHGVCSDIAEVYGIIYSSIGAKAYNVAMKSLNHAILMVRTQDSNGRYVYYMQDNENLYYIGKESDIRSDYLPYVKSVMGSDYPF